MKIRVYFIIIISLITLNSCVKSKPQISADFDEVEHYFEPKKDSIYNLIFKKGYENLTDIENKYLEIITGNNPEKIKDTSIIIDLKRSNFKKRIIQFNKHKELKEIFYSKACSEIAENGCEPIYRDVYIFKNKSKTIAIAKVCFECQIIYFVDSKNKWQKFGNCVEKLKTVD